MRFKRAALSPARCGWRGKDVVIGVLVICLVLVLFLLHRTEAERRELQASFAASLRATSENAQRMQARLTSAMTLLSEEEDTPGAVVLVPSKSPQVLLEGPTTIIVFCYNRADYLKRTLNSLFDRLYSDDARVFRAGKLRVIVSQDGNTERVRLVVDEFKAKYPIIEHLQHERLASAAPYYALAQHYGKGLRAAFADGSQRVIVLEDDLELAVDFFSYFAAFVPMLDQDASLLCVSAWNDHGQRQFIHPEADAGVVFRSDFFPGLGWMLSRKLWMEELERKWPDSYWDDWLREPAQRRHRHCIRPAITRTTTFGQSGGASGGLFFAQYLAPMELNQKHVASFHPELLDKTTFDHWFMEQVERAVVVTSLVQISSANKHDVAYKMVYKTLAQYEKEICKMLGMMPDVKAGVPRGAYRGVVPIRYNQARVFIVPAIIPALEI